ncbi:MAG TPA: DUF1109 domain-containing protein [Caulobacteraceae bacterium]|jgi:hypothetical protein|nr:DUF1109 domain-containing protein [Caulobacteraceae bacterium]
MRTDELIAALAADAPPVSPGGLRGRLAAASLVAAAAVAALVLIWLGMRPDIHIAMRQAAFWIKAGYALALAACGFSLTLRMGRPGARPGPALALAPAVFAALAGLAAAELLLMPESLRAHAVMGASWRVCPLLIMLISAPVFAAAIWALRGMAPTRLRLAGASAGLLAGGVGASVYGLHCQEMSPAFVTVWYSLGVVSCAVIGALLGPRLLRW